MRLCIHIDTSTHFELLGVHELQSTIMPLPTVLPHVSASTCVMLEKPSDP